LISSENIGSDVFTFLALELISNFLAGETTTSIQLIPFIFRVFLDNAILSSNKIIAKPTK
jgi:hypothetical protein